MAQASRDENRIPVLLGVSAIDASTPVEIYADDSTNSLYVIPVDGVPTDSAKANGSIVITYNVSDQPIKIEKTIGATTYTKTLTWTGTVCTAVSAWS